MVISTPGGLCVHVPHPGTKRSPGSHLPQCVPFLVQYGADDGHPFGASPEATVPLQHLKHVPEDPFPPQHTKPLEHGIDPECVQQPGTFDPLTHLLFRHALAWHAEALNQEQSLTETQQPGKVGPLTHL